MPRPTIWTYEAVKQEARKYETRIAFKQGNQTAYRVALNNGWLKQLGFPYRPKKWTVERILEEQAKYDSLSDFRRHQKHVYYEAKALGLLEEVSLPKIAEVLD